MARLFSGPHLRQARHAAGLRSDELAAAAGRSPWTIADYERGRIVPPAVVLGRLADALAVTVDDLFTPPPDPGPAAPVDLDGHRAAAPDAAVTVSEYARRLGRSPAYVRRLCRLGQLPARRTDRVWLIDAPQRGPQQP